MTLKTYKLSPNQVQALQALTETDPAKFAMPVNDGRAKTFSFPIEAMNEVAKTLALADRRSVDWTLLDVSDELIEFDAVWVDSEGTVKVKKMSLQFEGHELIVTDWSISPSDLDVILHVAGFDPDTFCESGDNWLEFKSDLIPAIVAGYLTMPETVEA